MTVAQAVDAVLNDTVVKILVGLASTTVSIVGPYVAHKVRKISKTHTAVFGTEIFDGGLITIAENHEDSITDIEEEVDKLGIRVRDLEKKCERRRDSKK